jgi:cysteine desulfurase
VASVPDAPTAPHLSEPAPRPPHGYLDAVAGQPILPVARTAWASAAEQGWSDPARLHHAGRRAGILLDAARASVADGLGVRPADVYFTSSGPTGIQFALGGLLAGRDRPRRVVTGAVESMAVLEPAGRLADRLDLVPVDPHGRVDVGAFVDALDTSASVACLQVANGEVGTRQPLREVAQAAADRDVPVLVHAIQCIGRDPVPVDWDVLVMSARDWGGPAGVGILAVRPTARWTPDASPDRGWVGGFPDIPGAVAAAAALEYVLPRAAQESERIASLVDRLRVDLPTDTPGVRAVGDPTDRLPHIVTFTIDDVVGEAVVTELDRRGVAVATGSACTSDTRLASHVLAAMGADGDASIRVSLPLGCTEESVALLLSAFPEAVAALRDPST